MNLTETESRLRDYLADKAALVPDGASPPGLLTPGRRRNWPALAAAAAIAAALILTVPLLIRITDRSAPPVAGSAGPPRLGVPYILSSGSSKTLYDGATEVPLRAKDDIVAVFGRVAGGWLVGVTEYPAVSTRVGVVDASGRFRQVGPERAAEVALSPDRTKIATTVWQYGKHARPHEVDLASGKILASVVPPFPFTYVAGWNADGVWYQEGSSKAGQPYVWRPGESQPEAVRVDGFDGISAVLSSTPRMVMRTRHGNQWCLRVVARQAPGKLTTLREHCGTGERSRDALLSPDGRVLAVPDDKLAIEVDTGRKVPLQGLPDAQVPELGDVFEDAENLLVTSVEKPQVSSTPRAGSTGIRSEQTISRCSVRTGHCELLFRSRSSSVTLGRP